MAHRWLPFLLLLVCVTPTRGAATSDTSTTCKVGDSTAGTRTSVTCYFNEDISVRRLAFSIAVYPFNASKDDIGRTVLACRWPESRTKPECLVKSGFSFNNSVTDRLTLEILNVTEECAGQYACSLVPSDHRTVQMCPLKLKVPGSETEKKYLRELEMQINQAENSQGGYVDFSRVNFVLNVLILVLLVVVGIVVAVVLIRKRRFCGEKAADEKQQTTESCHACVDMQPTTSLLDIHLLSNSPTSSDSGNSSDETNGVSLA